MGCGFRIGDRWCLGGKRRWDLELLFASGAVESLSDEGFVGFQCLAAVRARDGESFVVAFRFRWRFRCGCFRDVNRERLPAGGAVEGLTNEGFVGFQCLAAVRAGDGECAAHGMKQFVWLIETSEELRSRAR